MKRRSPTIWAAVVVLGIAGLTYRHANLQKGSAPLADQPAKTTAPDSSTDSATEGERVAPPVAAVHAAEPAGTSTRFHMMPDGSPVPALSPSAPERVKLGVVIFRYKGTQGSSESSRSREAALALALEATKVAQADFASAVKKGDHGSTENVGWIDQRILERAVEYAVFSLEKGEISKTPIDTPRGFWVAKRLR